MSAVGSSAPRACMLPYKAPTGSAVQRIRSPDYKKSRLVENCTVPFLAGGCSSDRPHPLDLLSQEWHHHVAHRPHCARFASHAHSRPAKAGRYVQLRCSFRDELMLLVSTPSSLGISTTEPVPPRSRKCTTLLQDAWVGRAGHKPPILAGGPGGFALSRVVRCSRPTRPARR